MKQSKNNKIPAIAVRGFVPIPNNDLRVDVGRPISLKALDIAEKEYDFNIVVLFQKDASVQDVELDNLYEFGALARISLKLKIPNDFFRIKLTLLKKVNVTSIELKDDYLEVEYEESKARNIEDSTTHALTKIISEDIMKSPNLYLNNSNEVIKKIESGISVEQFCDIISFNLKNPEDKVKYLEVDDLNTRLQLIAGDLNREKEFQNLENKINEAVKKSIDESQKEYYLREKMRAIQNELGEKARREDEIDEMRSKIKSSKMPEHIEQKVLNELKRFQDTSQQSAESQIIKNYLDFMIGLPWSVESKDNENMNKIQAVLDSNHYALDKVKDRILEYIAVKTMTKKNPQTILCLVGPPGVGKTTLAFSIAKALNRKFVKISLGGLRDESEIRGHRRTYIGALPGRIMKSMSDAKTINPVILLDEIDKMASDIKGDPASAMLEVLDPEQNKLFSDHYVEETYDLSKVLFITTANYIQNIPAPLRDRMEIVEVSSYTRYEKFNIARNHLIPKQLEIHGLTARQFKISDEAIEMLIDHYTAEAGVRELNRQIGTLVRKTIKDILFKKIKTGNITPQQVNEYLGKFKYKTSISNKEDKVGVVTGLAYTVFGGSTLEIEVTTYPGKGTLVLTGQLGDVMKESAQTAYSFVKSKAKDFKIDPEFFEKNDVHVHVPEGATPKDGPSAGVTITSAMVSALTNTKAKANIGMTGEVTLVGNVLPIGGLREKSISAYRQGIRKIIIPKENENDIDDIPEEVKDNMDIVLVSHVSEVLDQILVKKSK